MHESFRKPEIEALATLAGVNVEFIEYNECVCFTINADNKPPPPLEAKDRVDCRQER